MGHQQERKEKKRRRENRKSKRDTNRTGKKKIKKKLQLRDWGEGLEEGVGGLVYTWQQQAF